MKYVPSVVGAWMLAGGLLLSAPFTSFADEITTKTTTSIATAEDKVGKVIYLLGQADLTYSDGRVEPLKRQMDIPEGSLITVKQRGRVRLLMVDGETKILEANSQLSIPLYQFDPAHPQDSILSSKLIKGEVTNKTGQGGHAAKSRYRMETSSAVIGVMGTEYTVRVLGRETWVSVHEGIVSVSKLGGDCLPAAIGPCSGDTTMTLSAQQRGLALVVRTDQPKPVLVPAPPPTRSQAVETPTNAPVAESSSKDKSSSSSSTSSTGSAASTSAENSSSTSAEANTESKLIQSGAEKTSSTRQSPTVVKGESHSNQTTTAETTDKVGTRKQQTDETGSAEHTESKSNALVAASTDKPTNRKQQTDETDSKGNAESKSNVLVAASTDKPTNRKQQTDETDSKGNAESKSNALVAASTDKPTNRKQQTDETDSKGNTESKSNALVAASTDKPTNRKQQTAETGSVGSNKSKSNQVATTPVVSSDKTTTAILPSSATPSGGLTSVMTGNTAATNPENKQTTVSKSTDLLDSITPSVSVQVESKVTFVAPTLSTDTINTTTLITPVVTVPSTTTPVVTTPIVTAPVTTLSATDTLSTNFVTSTPVKTVTEVVNTNLVEVVKTDTIASNTAAGTTPIANTDTTTPVTGDNTASPNPSTNTSATSELPAVKWGKYDPAATNSNLVSYSEQVSDQYAKVVLPEPTGNYEIDRLKSASTALAQDKEQYSFKMGTYEANVTNANNGEKSAATLKDGHLTVSPVKQNFSTGFTLESTPYTGTVTATGTYADKDGTLIDDGTNAATKIRGAVGVQDGKAAAAYTFTHQIDSQLSADGAINWTGE